MVESLLNLEPSWPLLMDGDKATLLIEMVIFDPNNHKHLVRSAVHRKFLTVNGTLDHKAVAFTILGATVSKTNNRLGLILDHSSTVLSHHHLDCDSMFRSIETCSGGGFMKDGIDKGGFHVAATNDLRQSMADFQHRQGCCDMVVGDIGDDKTISELFHLHSKPCLVAGGFSCQPWSALGDKKGMLDCRSQSLTSILRAAFLMRSHSILLECVQNAGKDKQVREILNTFCRITGLRQVQIDLSLASFWPSRRARWWTVLYSHAFPPFHLMPLPSQLIPPTVNDLLPYLPDWPEEKISQIKLDSYEYGKFQQFGGIGPNCVNSRAPMSTALHGWSCQLIPCPCGCRKFPLADARLSEKGLFGALVHCPGNMQTPEGIVQNIRHLHPWEIALLSGIVPDKLWGPQLRFSIAALGQMATPIQSLWVVAQFKKHLLEGFLEIPAPKPEEVMWLHIGDIMVAYENFFPMGFHSDVVQNFLDRTHRCLFSHAAQGIVPPFLPSFKKNKGDLESNSIALPPGSITEIPVDQPCPKSASEGLFDQDGPITIGTVLRNEDGQGQTKRHTVPRVPFRAATHGRKHSPRQVKPTNQRILPGIVTIQIALCVALRIHCRQFRLSQTKSFCKEMSFLPFRRHFRSRFICPKLFKPRVMRHLVSLLCQCVEESLLSNPRNVPVRLPVRCMLRDLSPFQTFLPSRLLKSRQLNQTLLINLPLY